MRVRVIVLASGTRMVGAARMDVGVRMRMGVGGAVCVGVRVRMLVSMLVPVRAIMIVIMIVTVGSVSMRVVRPLGHALDPPVALAASAGGAHHTTSISLSRISSPPCTSSFAPSQRGQASPRARIVTEASQSRQ